MFRAGIETATRSSAFDHSHATAPTVPSIQSIFFLQAKGIYFCELCSLTFPTTIKVELHIDDPMHINEKYKTSPRLTRMENDIIAFNQFIISNDAWNGCVEDACVLCNVEFDDSSSHKVTRKHVLNLIKSEVIFDNVKKTVYRTVRLKILFILDRQCEYF